MHTHSSSSVSLIETRSVRFLQRRLRSATASVGLLLLLGVGSIATLRTSAADLFPVTLAWDSPSWAVTGYTLHYGTMSRLYTNEVTVGNVTTTVLENLVAGTRYYVAVTAFGDNGDQSEFSNEIQFVLGLPILRIEATTDNQVVITVKGRPGESYSLEATQSLTDWSAIGTVNLDANGFMDYLDEDSTLYPNRFYRTRQVTP